MLYVLLKSLAKAEPVVLALQNNKACVQGLVELLAIYRMIDNLVMQEVEDAQRGVVCCGVWWDRGFCVFFLGVEDVGVGG